MHWARDAAEAGAIVAAIVRETGAREALKVKSLTTDEIRLNESLAAAGIDVVETDLAELICQLAGEEPSHILVPAIRDVFRTPQLLGVEEASTLPYASSLCGACYEVCPVMIDIPRVLVHLRARVVESGASARSPSARPCERSPGRSETIGATAVHRRWGGSPAGRSRTTA